MRSLPASGHVSEKLANVLYECLKTMTPYNETKHRKQMGLSTDGDVTHTKGIEIVDTQIDTLEVNSSSTLSDTP
jgi:hypothetical protein